MFYIIQRAREKHKTGFISCQKVTVKLKIFDVNSMREAVSNMMSDPDMVDDLRTMGNRVLGRLSKRIEDFKQIKAKLLEDHAFGATYAISTC